MISSIFENNTAVTFHFIKEHCPETNFFVSLCPVNKLGCDIRFSKDKSIRSYRVSLGLYSVVKFFYSKSDALHCLGVRVLDLVTRGYTFTFKVD